jgi:hypothetical protein
LYHSEGCNICELVLHECYVNDLYTTTCSGMLGHHMYHGACTYIFHILFHLVVVSPTQGEGNHI